MKGMTNASKISQCLKDIYRPMLVSGTDIESIIKNINFNPNKYSIEYYDNLFNQFKIHLYTQLKEKCDKFLLQKYLGDCIIYFKNVQERIKMFTSKSVEHKEILNTIDVDSYLFVLTIVSVNLAAIKKLLLNEIEYFDYRISSDYDIAINNLSSFNENNDNLSSPTQNHENLSLPNQNHKYESTSRVTINLNKIESLMFISILEKKGILKFESKEDRNEFIEKNFNYKEQRNGKNQSEAMPMKNLISDMQKLDTNYDKERYKSVLERLYSKLTDIFRDYNY